MYVFIKLKYELSSNNYYYYKIVVALLVVTLQVLCSAFVHKVLIVFLEDVVDKIWFTILQYNAVYKWTPTNFNTQIHQVVSKHTSPVMRQLIFYVNFLKSNQRRAGPLSVDVHKRLWKGINRNNHVNVHVQIL